MTPIKGDLLPESRAGRTGLTLAALAFVLSVLTPMLTYWLVLANVLATGNPVVILGGLAVGLALAAASFIFTYKALFRDNDRNLASFVSFVLICLVGGFWLFMIIGEFASPH